MVDVVQPPWVKLYLSAYNLLMFLGFSYTLSTMSYNYYLDQVLLFPLVPAASSVLLHHAVLLAYAASATAVPAVPCYFLLQESFPTECWDSVGKVFQVLQVI